MQPYARPLSEQSPAAAPDPFGHVVVGIDETQESLLAAVQADVLRGPGAPLTLVAVAEQYLAAHAGLAASDAGAQLAAGASEDLQRAAQLVDADETLLRSGRLVPVLCRECERRGATLIAVGTRSHRRFAALTFGGHDTDALHGAECSLLLARAGWGPHPPDRILVAADGSPEARIAEEAARGLGERLGREVVAVAALADASGEAVSRAGRGDTILATGSLDDALRDAATAADLVVVGRAAPSNGDIAERITYAVPCSVVVVRSGARPTR